jgi:hypothetical protein
MARRLRRLKIPAFAVGSLAAGGLVASCSVPRSFTELSYDARHVPVPQGITLVKEIRSTEDGPGFTTTHSEQVTRTFHNPLPCTTLQEDWGSALRRAGRSFTLDLEPRLSGASGLSRITIDDRPEHLGITLGAISNEGNYISCDAPFIWSFNSPH